MLKKFLIFDEEYFIVLQYSVIPFKYQHSYRDKKHSVTPVHRCIAAALRLDQTDYFHLSN